MTMLKKSYQLNDIVVFSKSLNSKNPMGKMEGGSSSIKISNNIKLSRGKPFGSDFTPLF